MHATIENHKAFSPFHDLAKRVANMPQQRRKSIRLIDRAAALTGRPIAGSQNRHFSGRACSSTTFAVVAGAGKPVFENLRRAADDGSE
jgi:hypothetical protein